MAEGSNESQYGSRLQLVQQRQAARDVPLCAPVLRVPWIEFGVGFVSILLSLCLMISGAATTGMVSEREQPKNLTAIYVGIFFLIVGLVAFVVFGVHFSRIRHEMKKELFASRGLSVSPDEGTKMQTFPSTPMETTGAGVEEGASNQDSAYSSFTIPSTSSKGTGEASQLDPRRLPAVDYNRPRQQCLYAPYPGQYAPDRPTPYNAYYNPASDSYYLPNPQPHTSHDGRLPPNTQSQPGYHFQPQTQPCAVPPSHSNAVRPGLVPETVQVLNHAQPQYQGAPSDRQQRTVDPRSRRKVVGNPSVVHEPCAISTATDPQPPPSRRPRGNSAPNQTLASSSVVV